MSVQAPLLHTSPEHGWHARLELGIEANAGASRVRRDTQQGPLYLQRALYPEGSQWPHLYVLHPPGGMVGGDRLELGVAVEPGAAALVTTPAAQKLYRSAGSGALSQVRLRVAAGAALEWLPTETIVFDGARARLETEVRLAAGAAYCGWDIVCFGRPAAGEAFDRGHLSTNLRIERERPLDSSELVVNERAEVAGGSPILQRAWGLGKRAVLGNLYCAPRDADDAPALVELLREHLAAGDDHAVTTLDGVVVVRCVATSSEKARARLIAAWQLLRPQVFGRDATLPRIWRT